MRRRAEELARQRGLVVQPEQIVIGAGTEYFYALLAQFLGRGQRFAIEDPCHRTLAQVYSRSGAEVVPVPMDESGIRVAELEASGAPRRGKAWRAWAIWPGGQCGLERGDARLDRARRQRLDDHLFPAS